MPSHNPLKKSLIPFQIVSAVDLIASHAAVKNAFKASHTATAISLIPSHRSIQNCRNSSQLFQRYMKAATKATIAAIMITYGFAAHTALNAANTPFAALITPASFGMIVIIVPIADIIFPTTISTGPRAAATKATVMMTFLVPSSIELSQSTSFCIQPTIVLIAGISISPKEIASS